MTHVVEINNPALPIAGETRLAPKSAAGWRSSTASEFHSALADAQGINHNSHINHKVNVPRGAESGLGNAASQPRAAENEGSVPSSQPGQIWPDRSVPGEPGSDDRLGLREPSTGQQLPSTGSPLPSPEAIPPADLTGVIAATASGLLNTGNSAGSTAVLSATSLQQGVSALSVGLLSTNLGEGAPLNPGAGGLDPFSAVSLNSAVLNPALMASTSQANRVSQSEPKVLSLGTSMMGQAGSMSRAQETMQVQSEALHQVMRQSGTASLTRTEGSVALSQSEPMAEIARRLQAKSDGSTSRLASKVELSDLGMANRAEFGAPRQQLFAELLAPRSLTSSSDLRFGPNGVVGEASLKAAPLVPSPIAGVPIELNVTPTFRIPSGFEMTSGVAQGQIVTPFQHTAWAQELAQQAKFMVQDQVRFVELKLNPANLGTVEVVMKQEDDQTTLMFFAKNALVREALEATLQRLQKSFTDDGLDLGQAFVSDQSLAEHKEQRDLSFEQEGRSANAELTAPLPGEESEGLVPERLMVAANDHRLDVWA